MTRVIDGNTFEIAGGRAPSSGDLQTEWGGEQGYTPADECDLVRSRAPRSHCALSAAAS